MKELKDMSLEELWQLFPIILKEHNPEYDTWYREEKQHLLHLLDGYDICRINHIGSTSVKELVAKPIIDILLELSAACDIDQAAELLRQNGWIVMAQNNADKTLDLNKGYTPGGFAEKVFHLHIKPYGDWNELYFRDYLQQHSKAAREYEALKLGLKEQYEHNRDAYTDAKSQFVSEYTEKARREYPNRYLPL